MNGLVTDSSLTLAWYLVLALIEPLPIKVETMGYERARQEVLDLARQTGLTVYDAAYLELAMREA